MTEIEEWRPVVGYEGLYEVSNLGRVKSLERIDGAGRLRKGTILKPRMNTYGYLQVDLYKEGKGKIIQVHRLVGQAFIPNPEGLPQINHIDEDKTNNQVDNLEWCTARYNMNYGTGIERQVQTKISNGNADPEMCGVWNKDRKEYFRLYYQKNLEEMREQSRERQRKWREKNRDQINERRRERRRQKQKQTT